jgi:hypothetical protein
VILSAAAADVSAGGAEIEAIAVDQRGIAALGAARAGNRRGVGGIVEVVQKERAYADLAAGDPAGAPREVHAGKLTGRTPNLPAPRPLRLSNRTRRLRGMRQALTRRSATTRFQGESS